MIPNWEIVVTDVPYLPTEVIEDEASSLLAEFERDHRRIVEPPVPIDAIVELHLKLTFEISDLQKLFGHADVHGAIWFREERIAVDQQLDPDRFPAKRGRFHFTLAHETGHWRLHRKLFLKKTQAPSLFDGEPIRPDYICRTTQKKLPVEWQADNFAANLLMPRKLVRQEWECWRGDQGPICIHDLDQSQRSGLLAAEIARRKIAKSGPDAETDMILDQLSLPMAKRFEVSPEAMRRRLEDLGFVTRTKEASLFS